MSDEKNTAPEISGTVSGPSAGLKAGSGETPESRGIPPDRENQTGGVYMGNNTYRDPVFYYSRERRLNRASPEVQALNDGKNVRPSFSRTLFATRAHVLIFVTIVIICAMLGMASRIVGREQGISFGGNTVALVLFREEGDLILGVAKNMPKSGEAYTGVVDVAVSPVMPKPEEGETPEVPPVFTDRIFFMPVEAESFRLVIPFAGDDFLVLLKNDSEQKHLRVKVK